MYGINTIVCCTFQITKSKPPHWLIPRYSYVRKFGWEVVELVKACDTAAQGPNATNETTSYLPHLPRPLSHINPLLPLPILQCVMSLIPIVLRFTF